MLDFDSLKKRITSERLEDYKFIYELTKLKGGRVAFHGADADGVISAVIVKAVYPEKELIFIPLGYEILELEKFGTYLSTLDWFAIVDLPPFSECFLFCDHHQTNVDIEIKAEISLFNPKAPSAAFLLAENYKNIHDNIIELVKLTEITDVAGYTIPAPLEISSNYSTVQEKAWALNDVCKSLDSSKQIVELVHKLEAKGFEAIPHYYNEYIAIHRAKRKKSIEIAQHMTISDMVILNFADDTYNRFAILHELLQRGVKVGMVSVFEKSYYSLSFRHSKTLTKEEQIKFRVDELAEKLGGGGHISASGARVINLSDKIKEIVLWGKERGLNPIIKEIN